MEKPSSPESSRRWPFRRSARPRRLKSIALLPTLITMGNGVCGTLAIFEIGLGIPEPKGHFVLAAWLILVAMIFDALDGYVARMTNTASTFGAQMDSLCDLVSFGIAPAFLCFAMARGAYDPDDRIVFIVSVLYAMCALTRLARFTVETVPDESAHREFAGLPSPAAAGVIASAVILRVTPELATLVQNALPILAFTLGILMVSRFKYVHLVNRFLRGKRPFVKLVELMLVAVLLAALREFAIFLAFFVYAAVGPALWLKGRLFRKKTVPPVPAKRDTGVF